MTSNHPALAASDLISLLAPGGRPFVTRIPLADDESRWFLRAVEGSVVTFSPCPPECFRFKRWGSPGPDHFLTPADKPRHLFSKPVGPQAWLNREYIPHIAAYARAILDLGYDRDNSSFSLYRKFTRDLIAKRAGQDYETDAEFYDAEGGIRLQIEAKASPAQTNRLAAEIERAKVLSDLPMGTMKEIEYVLDLRPRYLWVVGPGSVDPSRFVFEVKVDGLNAGFRPVEALPAGSLSRSPSRDTYP
jgi:hypothetical protein